MVEITEAPREYSFEVEAYTKKEFEEVIEILIWVGEHASSNGRVDFSFKGGAYQEGHWLNGKITFTNDENDEDATLFKMRWC